MFFVYIITYTNKNAIIFFKKAHDISAKKIPAFKDCPF